MEDDVKYQISQNAVCCGLGDTTNEDISSLGIHSVVLYYVGLGT